MIALLTSCGRSDLLHKTLTSLCENLNLKLNIKLHEDSVNGIITIGPIINSTVEVFLTGGIGQHKSIELFLKNTNYVKYYLHLEDDWHFENSYDWISESIKIMEADQSIIKVLARTDSPHPCVHDMVRIADDIIKTDPNEYFEVSNNMRFGYLHPWENEGIKWGGFSWNPGVTRLDILKQYIPFPSHEQYLSEQIYNDGYKVVELKKPIYSHIGDGRSTHD